MNDTPEKYTTADRCYRDADRNETSCTGYSDYDPEEGPVYVIEADGDDDRDAWIQSTRPVDVEP